MSVVVIGAAVFLIPLLLRSDFKTELAKQLNVEKDLLHLNVPPARARFPGFTFVIKPALIPIEYPNRSDPDITEGQEFSLDWTSANLSSASGKNAGPIGAIFANSQGVNIELRALHCKVIEMTLADLKRRLLASSDVLDQAAKGNQPMVIVRSFEGQLEIRLAKTGKASADVWFGVRKRAEELREPSGKQEVEIQDTGSDQMVMSWKEPVVFAYEVMKAEIITTHLGVQPDDVKFSPVPSTELDALIPSKEAGSSQSYATPVLHFRLSDVAILSRSFCPRRIILSALEESTDILDGANVAKITQRLKSFQANQFNLTVGAASGLYQCADPVRAPSPRPSIATGTKSQPWGIATLSAGFYPQVQWLQQEWNASNADTFEQALSIYKPALQKRFRATEDRPSTSNGVIEFLRSAGSEASAQGIKLLVVYYVGHAVTRSNGDVLLVQGPITTEMLRSLEKTADDAQLLKPLARLANLADELMLPDGFLRLSDLHAALSRSGVPFVLLVDGCMENNTFSKFVESLGFIYKHKADQSTHKADPPYTLYYTGTAPIVFHEIFDLADRMRHFPDELPYLKDINPVILAAKPGTVAPMKENPEWSGGLPVAPLTLEAYKASLRAQIANEPPSLADFVEALAGFRGTGEISMDGAISWSDFSQIEKAARRIRINLQARSPQNATSVIRRVFHPALGKIQDFVFDEAHQDFIIVANQWYLWQWAEGKKATPMKDDVPFLTIAGCCSGENYVHVGNDHELLSIDPTGSLKTIKQNCYLAVMGPGHKSESVIVADGPSAVGGAEPIWRLQNGRLVELDKMETAFLSDLIEWLPGTVCYTLEDQSVIYRRENGISRELCRALDSPHLLAASGDYLYCLNFKGEIIYRSNKQGAVRRADLLTLEPSLTIDRTPYTRGFKARPSGTLLIASGDSIIEIDPAQLTWESLAGP